MARCGDHLGDKTVVVVLDVVGTAVDGLADPLELYARAQLATANTLDAFRGKPNRLGRARMFAEKSIGLDDPGMLAFSRLLEGLERQNAC